MAISNASDIKVEPSSRPAGNGFIGFLKQHPIGFWFIFWGEFAERCSYYGMRAILSVYMAEQLGLGRSNATTYMSFFIAACYFLPLVGGFLADNFFGKYRTIVWFSIPYILGHVVLGIEEPLYLFIALCLLAMGSGVIKPNISTLMGMTYDQQRPGQEQLRSSAFSMFYMAINIGAAISQFVIPLLRTRYGYSIAFLFPAVLMAIAFAIFASGRKFYAIEKIERRHKTPEERALQWKVLGRILGLFLLVMFFWAIFDQASSTWIFFAYSYMDWTVLPGLQVEPEQMQALNPVLIVLLLPAITYLWVALDRRGIKVRATDKMLIGFLLTAACMGVTAVAGYLAGPSETLLAPSANRVVTAQAAKTAEDQLPALRAGSVAAAIAAPSTPSAAAALMLPDVLNHGYVRTDNKVSIWWQIIAYLVITVAEILVSVTGLELAFVAAPKSMTSFVTSLWLLTVFLGNLLINAPIARLYPVMNPGTYFLMFSAMMVAVVIIFIPVARRFNRIVAEEAALERALSEGITAQPHFREDEGISKLPGE